ncbi:NAD(+)/NADH kinase [Candidatus Comchoanobacter bicostacola]|uniref:NAD kinase n=1 Tax=Candidatus Comchoanobacter bicostacola TaxID=2919598 RepID=A0ABY5DK85_9GAMM|nr:NAD(+)/NADH kinase [Candidatus Comchoanobacter bicostacola]UTC24392.1 NAD(+)/NADH kinase [Candidatus Comchoanobacter bicostacola]
MSHFKQVVLFSFKSDAKKVAKISEVIESAGVSIIDEVFMSKADLIIVMGGDGTMLHQAKIAYQYNIPILGINDGHTGFLADIEYSNASSVLKAILEGHYFEDYRTVFECMFSGEKHIAINELMLSKSQANRMIRYEVFVDERFMYNQTGDGLIVSTATGSTAYALSAGGQIIHPEVDVMSLVPICPRHLSARPVIIPSSSNVVLNIQKWKGSCTNISIDGKEIEVIESLSNIQIKCSEKKLKLIHPLHYDFYQTLHSKLNWETNS